MHLLEGSLLSVQASDWAKQAYAYIKPACARTLWPVSCALSMITGFAQLFPDLFYNEEDQIDPENVVIKTERDIEEVKKMYIKKALIFDESIQDKKIFIQTVKEVIEKSVLFNFQMMSDFNQSFDTEAQLCYSVEDQPAPYCVVGGKSSLSEPFIRIRMPSLKITSNEAMEAIEQLLADSIQSFNPDEKKFLLAREFAHIVHNDHLILSTVRVAASVLNFLAWYTTERESWISYVAFGALKAFGIELLLEIALSFCSRSLELRADRKAMDFLGTEKGALAFLEKMSLLPEQGDHFTLSLKSRIQQAKLWKLEPSVA